MIDIVVKNLRHEKPTHPWQIKVDRSSSLGNPFYMSDESMRDQVCNQYEEYFKLKSTSDSIFIKEINHLIEVYKTYGRLELFCWCAPKRCHASTIKNFMIRLLETS